MENDKREKMYDTCQTMDGVGICVGLIVRFKYQNSFFIYICLCLTVGKKWVDWVLVKGGGSGLVYLTRGRNGPGYVWWWAWVYDFLIYMDLDQDYE